MGGMKALFHPDGLAQAAAGGGLVHGDAVGALFGVVGTQQLIHRHIHKVRVAQIAARSW